MGHIPEKDRLRIRIRMRIKPPLRKWGLMRKKDIRRIS
jgi:hypothetical protein